MSKINSTKHQLCDLIRGIENEAEYYAKITALFDQLKPALADKLEAQLPIRDIDFGRVEIHWSGLYFGEDYETSYTYEVEHPADGYLTLTEDEKEVEIEKANKMVEIMDLGLDDDQLSDEEASKLRENRNAYTDYIYNLEHADQEYPELMWNYSWQPFNDDVDTEIVDSIPGITWVSKTSCESRFDRDNDLVPGSTAPEGRYLTLTCIGQDMGPALMAYNALKYECVDPEHVRYWTQERSWTEHVIGRSTFLRCAEALGVKEILEKELAKDDAAAKKKQEEEQARREKAKQQYDLPLDPATVEFLRRKPSYTRIYDLQHARHAELDKLEDYPNNLDTDVIMRDLLRLRECSAVFSLSAAEILEHHKIPTC